MSTEKPFIPIINQRIAQIRNYQQLMQKDFADNIGVSRSYISLVENGKSKPSIEMLTGIASCYPDINPGWLLTGQGDMHNIPKDPSPPITPPVPKEPSTHTLEKEFKQTLKQINDKLTQLQTSQAQLSQNEQLTAIYAKVQLLERTIARVTKKFQQLIKILTKKGIVGLNV